MATVQQIVNWHRNWNIIDCYHDNKGITSNKLFKDSLMKLFNSNRKLHDYSFFQSHYGFREQYAPGSAPPVPPYALDRGVNHSAYFNGLGIFEGVQDNNPNPDDFGLAPKFTISQIFDPSSKSFAPYFTTCTTPYVHREVINAQLGNFCQFSYKRTETTAGDHEDGFHFTVKTDVTGVGPSPQYTYTMFVMTNGEIKQSNPMVDSKDSIYDYIGGNQVKIDFIKSHTLNSANLRIASGFILCKLLGDLSHTWFCDPNSLICTTDTFLLKRCVIAGKSCLFGRKEAGTTIYIFFYSHSTRAPARFAALFNAPHIGGSGRHRKPIPDKPIPDEIFEKIGDVFFQKDLSSIRASSKLIEEMRPHIINNIINNIIKIDNKITEFEAIYNENPTQLLYGKESEHVSIRTTRLSLQKINKRLAEILKKY
jgi:hypothetical protein